MRSVTRAGQAVVALTAILLFGEGCARGEAPQPTEVDDASSATESSAPSERTSVAAPHSGMATQDGASSGLTAGFIAPNSSVGEVQDQTVGELERARDMVRAALGRCAHRNRALHNPFMLSIRTRNVRNGGAPVFDARSIVGVQLQERELVCLSEVFAQIEGPRFRLEQAITHGDSTVLAATSDGASLQFRYRSLEAEKRD